MYSDTVTTKLFERRMHRSFYAEKANKGIQLKISILFFSEKFFVYFEFYSFEGFAFSEKART